MEPYRSVQSTRQGNPVNFTVTEKCYEILEVWMLNLYHQAHEYFNNFTETLECPSITFPTISKLLLTTNI